MVVLQIVSGFEFSEKPRFCEKVAGKLFQPMKKHLHDVFFIITEVKF